MGNYVKHFSFDDYLSILSLCIVHVVSYFGRLGMPALCILCASCITYHNHKSQITTHIIPDLLYRYYYDTNYNYRQKRSEFESRNRSFGRLFYCVAISMGNYNEY
jgi:hypothetical protein